MIEKSAFLKGYPLQEFKFEFKFQMKVLMWSTAMIFILTSRSFQYH